MQNSIYRRRGFCINSNSGSASLPNPWAIQCKYGNKTLLEYVYTLYDISPAATTPSKRKTVPPEPPYGMLAEVVEGQRNACPPPTAYNDSKKHPAFHNPGEIRKEHNPPNIIVQTWAHWLEAEKLITAGYTWDAGIGQYAHDAHPYEKGSHPTGNLRPPSPTFASSSPSHGGFTIRRGGRGLGGLQRLPFATPTAPRRRLPAGCTVHCRSGAHGARREPQATQNHENLERGRGSQFHRQETGRELKTARDQELMKISDAIQHVSPGPQRAKRVANTLCQAEAPLTKRRRVLRTQVSRKEREMRRKMMGGAGSDADISE
ncbi:hypothetical protein B0H10DRAFT_2128841 [Mycena sp. CBHHK59/15]|nr:hypothetical protein B0H10DRAFT_2128841 [Mycena sp. CBHHK59/15]